MLTMVRLHWTHCTSQGQRYHRHKKIANIPGRKSWVKSRDEEKLLSGSVAAAC